MRRSSRPPRLGQISGESLATARRRRLDQALVERGLASSREKAQALVLAGQVLVDGALAAKPGTPTRAESRLELLAQPPFVSRGGTKLAHGLDRFGIVPFGRVALDAGASTGGFTDVLLQRGAARVYAVDVGYGQLDYRLRADARVVVMERVNVRHLTSLPERPSLAVLDLSFISLTQVLPAVAHLVSDGADVVALIKPQFEAGRQSVGRGVVRSEAVWREVLERLAAWLDQNGWCLEGLSASPLRGASGNVEFLAHLCLGVSSRPAAPLIHAALDEARTLATP